jgi:hypothetical protein
MARRHWQGKAYDGESPSTFLDLADAHEALVDGVPGGQPTGTREGLGNSPMWELVGLDATRRHESDSPSIHGGLPQRPWIRAPATQLLARRNPAAERSGLLRVDAVGWMMIHLL